MASNGGKKTKWFVSDIHGGCIGFLQVFGCWLNWNLFATASLRRKGEVFSGKIHCKKTI